LFAGLALSLSAPGAVADLLIVAPSGTPFRNVGAAVSAAHEGDVALCDSTRHVLFSHCKFIGNQATDYGGSLYIRASVPATGSTTISQCLIAGNRSARGSAIMTTAITRILSSTLTGNQASTSATITCTHIADVHVSDSILWHNTSADGYQASLLVAVHGSTA
jgi:hypothetical protein